MTDDKPMADDEPIHVGDHVVDREADPDDRMRMVVVSRTGLSAAECKIDDGGRTIADANPSYDASAAVVDVVFASRADRDLGDLTRYGYPVPRLERVAAVHPEDDDE